MKEKMINNFGLKILAVLSAIFLWITIINVNDPNDTRQIYNIPVDMLNVESLTELGYTFEVLEGSTITATIWGPTSVIGGLTSQDFYASADFSKISPLSDYVDIDIKCVKPSVSDSNITVTPRTSAVKINIENRESRTLDVEVNLVGNPASGYTIGDYDVSPMSIKITGAASMVDSVAHVVAEYDVEGASLDISDSVTLRLYDENDLPIDTEGLILSKSEVRLKVPLLIKKVIPINYAYTGTVKEGYKISKITPSIENIVIAGTASAIANISSIDLPADLINVSDLDQSKTFTVRISHYVPANVKIISDVLSEVQVDVEALVTKNFQLPTDKITIDNSNDAYKYSFSRNSISVTYSGLSADIENIAIAGITAKVDVAGLGVGTHSVKVALENTNGCTVVGEYTATIVISR